ncbi:MAG: (deoxy)nucleoside triphosphate pyrophosphohydrolase [Bacteroidota bacterium]
MKQIHVVAAVIISDNKILCVQRNENKLHYISKKYEFPGGKIELGESKEEAIKREIKEELKMEINIDREFLTVRHQYPDFHLTMYSFLCSCKDSSLTLTEHIDFKWLDKNDLGDLDWAAADIPIVNKLASNG